MADKTKIQWTDASWNPLRGCTRVSPGCVHCYAETVAARFSGKGQPYEGLAEWVTRPGGRREARWTGKVALVEHLVDQPLKWQDPRRIFVNSMSDLFHESVPDGWIDRIFAVMALTPQHTYQILTKRPERMRAWFAERWQPAPAYRLPSGLNVPAETTGEDRRSQVAVACEEFLDRFKLADPDKDGLWTEGGRCKAMQWQWPLSNCWLGVSVEDQTRADERIPILLDTPAVVRWVSAEPLLGPLDLTAYLGSDDAPDRDGGISLSSGGSGSDRGSPRRVGLENSKQIQEPLGRQDHYSADAASQDRPDEEQRLSPGEDYDGWETSNDPCSPSGLACPSGSDPERDDGQSQGRDQGPQPSGEPGAGDVCRADLSRGTCPSGRQNPSPTWGEESRREADRRSSSVDQSSTESRRSVGVDRHGLRGRHANGIEDRKGRPSISWLIIGGESGPGARAMDIRWARTLLEACRAAGVPAFMKQLGRFVRMGRSDAVQPCALGGGWRADGPGSDQGIVEMPHSKGGDPIQWPEDLRVREWPRAA